MKKIALVIIVSAALYIVACSLEDSWPIATTDPHVLILAHLLVKNIMIVKLEIMNMNL